MTSKELIVVGGPNGAGKSNHALTGDESFVVESTLSGRTFQHLLRDATAAGFTITIVYLLLDSANTCVERVHQRVQKGGHFVPDGDIRRRFRRSLLNFWHLYRPLCDHWLLVYNSGNQPQDVGVGTASDLSIRDAELYAQFTRLIEADTDG